MGYESHRYQVIDVSGEPLIRKQTLQLYKLLDEIKLKHDVEIEICSSGELELITEFCPIKHDFGSLIIMTR